MTPNTITVVTGLPRSGTSMLMQMLEAGGLPLLSDDARPADDDNPRGYFEFAPVKRLRADASWMAQARGKGIKVISYLLPYLPVGENYRVIFIVRPVAEVLASQARMLRKAPETASDGLAEIMARQDAHARTFIAEHALPCLDLRHGELLAEPETAAEQVAAFVGGRLDARAMAAVVRPELHRQRAL